MLEMAVTFYDKAKTIVVEGTFLGSGKKNEKEEYALSTQNLRSNPTMQNTAMWGQVGTTTQKIPIRLWATMKNFHSQPQAGWYHCMFWCWTTTSSHASTTLHSSPRQQHWFSSEQPCQCSLWGFTVQNFYLSTFDNLDNRHWCYTCSHPQGYCWQNCQCCYLNPAKYHRRGSVPL